MQIHRAFCAQHSLPSVRSLVHTRTSFRNGLSAGRILRDRKSARSVLTPCLSPLCVCTDRSRAQQMLDLQCPGAPTVSCRQTPRGTIQRSERLPFVTDVCKSAICDLMTFYNFSPRVDATFFSPAAAAASRTRAATLSSFDMTPVISSPSATTQAPCERRQIHDEQRLQLRCVEKRVSKCETSFCICIQNFHCLLIHGREDITWTNRAA